MLTLQARIRDILRQVFILPRRLCLETPGVYADVTLLRSVFGSALRGLDEDIYAKVFAPPQQSGANMTPGYAMRPAPPDAKTSPAVDFVLIGNAIEHHDAILRAWDIASGMGLGKSRARFFVRRALALLPNGGYIHDRQRKVGWALAELCSDERVSEFEWPIRVRFVTPLRLIRNGQLESEPTLRDLAVGVWRRVGAYVPTQIRQEHEAVQDEIFEVANRILTIPWQGDPTEVKRWSASQQQELHLQGVLGSLGLPQGAGLLYDLLRVGTWLQIGKGTTIGMGSFVLESLDQP